MKRIAKIVSVGETRTGKSDKTGEPWYRTDVVIKWQEEEPPFQPYECRLVVTLSSRPDREKLTEAINKETDVQVTFYPNVHEYKDRVYNSITAYLPAEYKYEEAKTL